MRPLLFLMGFCAAARMAAAQPPPRDPIAAIRADQWEQADEIAAGFADPVARKLVLFYRLLTPGAARAAEIAAFMGTNPDWPSQAALGRRLQEALAAEGDDRAVLALCVARPPTVPPAILRCADATTRVGQATDTTTQARRAWANGIVDPQAETAFVRAWGRALTADDQWRRFDRLAWIGPALPGSAAARQAVRVDPAMRPAAEARLALRRDDPAAGSLVALLPATLRADPTMVLEHARWLRRAGQDAAALAVWLTQGEAAETAAPAERVAAFWTERELLARRRLRAEDPAGAYALVLGQKQPGIGQRADAAFLAGWIALRRLDRPVEAAAQFRLLTTLSGAAITQGRAWYWLGRALAVQEDRQGSQDAYAEAARWPTTYYGQLAALAGGATVAELEAGLRAARDPAWTTDQALDFAGREVVRAATLLAAWGESRRARAFVALLDGDTANDVARAMAARLATGLGLADQAVMIARRAGRDGILLPQAGWPMAYDPPPTIDTPLALAIMRQESSFDPAALSPSGARGLMQLMPPTAQEVARRLGERVDLDALTTDPGLNMRLGTAYLRGLLARFGGAVPLAVAAYNAGPGRVQEWLASNGDPNAGADALDWIELIPFAETRNYVQRVIENQVVYQAFTDSPTPHPLARWLG